MKFAFIHAEKASFPIAFMCEQLGVSRSGYYAWASRPESLRRRLRERLLLAPQLALELLHPLLRCDQLLARLTAPRI